MKNTKPLLKKEIPVESVKDISLHYGFSNGNGAFNGLLMGSLIGLGMGILSGATALASEFIEAYTFGVLFSGATL